MGRFTVRLPDTLHRQVEDQARREGISLNQYVVYALTRQATLAYTVESVPQETIREHRARYVALLEQLGPSTYPEIERALAERDAVDPEDGLAPDIVERLRRRFAGDV